MRRAWLTLMLAATIAACSPQGSPREPAEATGGNTLDAEAAAVADIQERTEIDALKNRVVTLEREVGELKANPQALDLDLLTQRVERLEAATAIGAAAAPTEASRTAPGDRDRAQRAVDAAIAERRAKRDARE